MPATIVDVQPITNEIVLQERVTSNEFVINEIHENIAGRFVRVEIELGPFTQEQGPGNRSGRRGASRRGITVWRDEAYDAVRDTWSNTDLVTAVSAIMNAG